MIHRNRKNRKGTAILLASALIMSGAGNRLGEIVAYGAPETEEGGRPEPENWPITGIRMPRGLSRQKPRILPRTRSGSPRRKNFWNLPKTVCQSGILRERPLFWMRTSISRTRTTLGRFLCSQGHLREMATESSVFPSPGLVLIWACSGMYRKGQW